MCICHTTRVCHRMQTIYIRKLNCPQVWHAYIHASYCTLVATLFLLSLLSLSSRVSNHHHHHESSSSSCSSSSSSPYSSRVSDHHHHHHRCASASGKLQFFVRFNARQVVGPRFCRGRFAHLAEAIRCHLCRLKFLSQVRVKPSRLSSAGTPSFRSVVDRE